MYAAIAAEAGRELATTSQLQVTCVPKQLDLGHIHLLNQELCIRPSLAAWSIIHAVPPERTAELLAALARHWRYAETVEALVADAPGLAPLAVTAAAKHSTDTVLADVLRATRGMHSGALSDAVESALASRPRASIRDGAAFGELTPRELQVLGLMADGRRNDEMAAELYISLATVKTHINHIFTKLAVDSRVQAVLAYRQYLAR